MDILGRSYMLIANFLLHAKFFELKTEQHWRAPSLDSSVQSQNKRGGDNVISVVPCSSN